MDSVEPTLKACGFTDIKVVCKEESKDFIKNWLPGSGCENFVVSANITATKPISSASSIVLPTPSPVVVPTTPDPCCPTDTKAKQECPPDAQGKKRS